MIPPFIIEQIRKNERRQREQRQQPQLELPLPFPPVPGQKHRQDDTGDRGVVIIEVF